MKEFMPYVVTIITTAMSGLLAYFSATRKAKTDLTALKESNRLEIEKLMSQHRLDLEALERKHEMEIEKMKLEHKHRLESSQKEMENNLGVNVINTVMSEAMKTPEMRQAISQGVRQNKAKR